MKMQVGKVEVVNGQATRETALLHPANAALWYLSQIERDPFQWQGSPCWMK